MGAELRTGMQVTEWLRNAGYKVGKSKVFADIKAGLLVRDNGIFTERALRAYASSVDLPLASGAPVHAGEDGELRVKLLTARAKKTEEEARRVEIARKRDEGKLVEVVDVDRRVAQAAQVVHGSMRQFFYSSAEEIISICNGDPSTSQALREYLLDSANEWFGGFAKKREFEVTE